MFVLASLFAGAATAAVAQEPQPRSGPVSQQEIAETVGPGTLDSPVSLLDGIEVTAGEEGTNGAIRIGLATPAPGGRFHAFTLTAGAGTDKSTGETFSSLDPVASGAFLEGRYTFTQLLGRRDPQGEALDFCEEVERSTHRPMGSDGCSSGYIRAAAPSRLADFDALYFVRPRVLFAGVAGRIGREEFEYLEPATGSKADTTHTPWSASGFVGYSYLPWRMAVSLEFRHQERFKAATTAAVCPVGSGSSVVCPVGPVGAPTAREQDILAFEYRQRLGNIGFAVRTSYDFDNEIFQLDLPVYFIGDGKLGLNAGVRARYVDDPDPDDENEGWVFGIFISKSFSLTEH